MAVILGFTALVILYQLRVLLGLIPRALALARAVMILPYYLAAMLPQFLVMLLVPFVLEPMLALAWRARRYLADATAVQLTRNPDWLAGGLAALSQRGGGVPSGRWAAPLFIVGGKVIPTRAFSGAERAELELLEHELAKPPPAPDSDGDASALRLRQAARRKALAAHAAAAEREAAGAAGITVFGGGRGAGSVSYFPPLRSRLARLQRMGSNVAPGRRTRGLMLTGLARAWRHPKELLPLGLLLFLMLAWLAAVALLTVLSLGLAALFMGFDYGLLQLLRPA
jgi:Zn-dependent protease with chaperone function